jgi:hypothetical protein
MLKRIDEFDEDSNDASVCETAGVEATGSQWITPDTQAFVISLLFHLVLILGLAVVPFVAAPDAVALLIKALPPETIEEFQLVEDVAASEEPSIRVGANSDATDSSMALSAAPILSNLSELPSPSFEAPVLDAQYDLNNRLEQAVGLVRSNTVVKGMTGVGVNGTDGAVDQITYEILRMMEERPTLVVWFFDQSISQFRRRAQIRDRFERIYEELGIVERSKAELESSKPEDEPLLTSMFAFGSRVNLLISKPTADINVIRTAIDGIQQDDTGIELVFSAIYKGIEKFKSYRSSRSSRGPERNVAFIVVTDERGDDAEGLEATIRECTKYKIPVYVIGSPAPFGREQSYVKYIDPDPNYDQTPVWAPIDQGPESILPERVKLGYRDDSHNEPVIDSGFGSYALSRLTYDTGGMYFAVHPNRRLGGRVSGQEIEAFESRMEYFFNPEVMEKYRPDYVSRDEYMKRVQASPLRQVLVRAAQLPTVDTLINPQMRFVKRDEAGFVNELTQAQQPAARVGPALDTLAETLKQGEPHRGREVSPRWIAGFDLALGTVLAHKVRSQTYNEMLARAKRGMNFDSPQNNTWVLRPDKEISVGSRMQKEGERAEELLKHVAERHHGTPWGLLAERELRTPMGWKWVEEYTDLNPPPSGNNASQATPNPTPPQDDQARMLAPPPPKRPVPKL